MLHQFDSRLGVPLFESRDESLYPYAGIVMLLLMPAHRAIPGCTHEPFLVGKVLNDASDEPLRQLANVWRRTTTGERLL